MKIIGHAVRRFSEARLLKRGPCLPQARVIYTAAAMAEPRSDVPACGKNFAPVVELDDQVREYLTIALGEERLAKILLSMCRPPLETCIRVNTQRCSPHEALDLLKAHLDDRQDRDASQQPHVHPVLKNVLCIPGSRGKTPNYTDLKEVVVTRKAGEAVLRGAPVFAPGVLAMSKHLVEGDTVAVCIAREIPGAGPADGPGRDRSGYYIGVGVLEMPRKEIFNGGRGVAVSLQQRVFGAPPFPEVLKERGWAALQNLPSTVAAAVLDAQPGMRVVDMCAAPGGKTCALADAMCNRGTVVAFDRSADKSLLVKSMVRQYGHEAVVSAFRKDSTCLVHVPPEVQARFRSKAPHAGGGSAGAPAPSTACTGSTKTESAGSGKRTGRSTEPLSESEVKRRARRAALAAQLGHPEPKNNRIPAAQQPLESSAEGSLQVDAPVADEGPQWMDRESFDRVLLDAPCSALGLRPRLAVGTTLRDLEQAAHYQRMLIREAVHVLAVGGEMVYSTCTLNPAENEGNIRWLLDRYPQMELIPQSPRLGGPGIAGSGAVPCSRSSARRVEVWLSADEAALCQRFDVTTGLDSIAFFIAKLRKVASIPEEDGCVGIPASLGAVAEG